MHLSRRGHLGYTKKNRGEPEFSPIVGRYLGSQNSQPPENQIGRIWLDNLKSANGFAIAGYY